MAYFCLKYRSPLATTASPDDAITGRRRNWTALLAIVEIFHWGGGGGDSDMVCDPSDEVEWRFCSARLKVCGIG